MIEGNLICGKCYKTFRFYDDKPEALLEVFKEFLNAHEGHDLGWESDY